MNCPFAPGADSVPDIWAGRTDELSDWADKLLPKRLSGQAERGRMVLGEPGIGKSVLTERIASQARAQGHFVLDPVRVPKSDWENDRGVSSLVLLAESIVAAADRHGLAAENTAKRYLRRLESVTIGGAELDLRPEEQPLHRAVFHSLVQLALLAAQSEKVVLVRIDEVQNTQPPDLSQLLVCLADALAETHDVPDAAGTVHERALPLTVYLTGLPEFQDLATSEAGATFGRRFLPIILTAIDDSELRQALYPFVDAGWPVAARDGEARVTTEPGAIDALLGHVLGDPFLFQLAGERAWEAGDGPVISVEEVEQGWQTAVEEARRHVSRALDRVPLREREVLEAMADLPEGERSAMNIAQAMGHESSASIGPYAQRLETVRGLIQRRRRQYSFTARTVGAYLNGDWP